MSTSSGPITRVFICPRLRSSRTMRPVNTRMCSCRCHTHNQRHDRYQRPSQSSTTSSDTGYSGATYMTGGTFGYASTTTARSSTAPTVNSEGRTNLHASTVRVQTEDEDDPLPPESTPVIQEHLGSIWIVYNGRRTEDDQRICGAFDDSNFVRSLVAGVPHQSCTEFESVNDARAEWERAWESGEMLYPVHSCSIWPSMQRAPIGPTTVPRQLPPIPTSRSARAHSRVAHQASTNPNTIVPDLLLCQSKVFVVIRGAQPGIHFNPHDACIATGGHARAWVYIADDQADAFLYQIWYARYMEILE